MHVEEDFARLAAEGYNRVPVVFETLADLDTPLSVYLKIARGRYSYLLESAQGGERWGRYSIIGLPCQTVLRVVGQRVTITSNGDTTEDLEVDDPLAFVEAFQSRYRVPPLPDMPRFYGGLVGYFGYDCVRYVEKRLRGSTPPDPLGTPDIVLMVSEDVIVFDNLKGRMQLISLVDPSEPGIFEATRERLRQRARGLADAHGANAVAGAKPPSRAAPSFRPSPHPGTSPDAQRSKPDLNSPPQPTGKRPQRPQGKRLRLGIRRRTLQGGGATHSRLHARRRCHAGGPRAAHVHTIQCRPPLTCTAPCAASTPPPTCTSWTCAISRSSVPRRRFLPGLKTASPSNRPLAGTRRRGHTPEEDLAMERELLADPKEIAEHLMLIDLGRNDLGKVCEIGSVEVTEQFAIERYSHVMHIASHVIGKLQEGKTAMDLLRATPAGRHPFRRAENSRHGNHR